MKTHQAQSPSASLQPNAPPPLVILDDLMVEILSWLPVKSLLKIRCVCKSWKSTISDPNFVKLHLHRSARNANLLLFFEKETEDVDFHKSVVPCSVRSLLGNPSFTIDEDDCFQLDNGSGYEVVGSCNGLVCLIGKYYSPNYCFSLWNPATKLTSKVLACFRATDRYYNMFAFGYDNLSDTYKVLAFSFISKAKEESQKKQVKICSLGDNCWRNVHSFSVIPFKTLQYPEHNNGVYFNNTLNWLALCNINSDDYIWNNTITIAQLVIVSFDLGMETCTQLLLPHLHEAPPVEPTIGVLMDCLCFSHDSNRTHFVVWQMKEFGVEKSWTQFMKVSYQDLQFHFSQYPYPLLPLRMSENGDVLIMATAGEMQAILYHWRDNRVERTKLPKYISWHSTMDYVESLVSPFCN